MKRLRAAVCVSLLLLVAVSAAADLSLPDLFKRAKERFAAADYRGSLADFEMLDAVSARPGSTVDRTKLQPVIMFYRGSFSCLVKGITCQKCLHVKNVITKESNIYGLAGVSQAYGRAPSMSCSAPVSLLKKYIQVVTNKQTIIPLLRNRHS